MSNNLWDQIGDGNLAIEGALKTLELIAQKRQEIIEQHQADLKALEIHEQATEVVLRHLRNYVETKKVREVESNGHLKNIPMREAIHVILARNEAPMPVPELIQALLQAGVNLGKKPQRNLANVKTTIANNSKRFIYSQENDTVALANQ